MVLPVLCVYLAVSSTLYAGRAAEFSEHDFGLVLKLPKDVLDPIDTIVVLDLEAKS